MPESNAKTCGSLKEIARQLEENPDEFLQPPYEKPYEDLCVVDHKKALALAARVNASRVSKIARQAYVSTWKSIPVPEICGLVSDDADTLATLLLAKTALTDFTKERLNWYISGRIPMGYIGIHPDGRWLIL